MKGGLDSIESIENLMKEEKNESLPTMNKNNIFENNTAMHHTAMTYSSIQKMKNKEKEKPKQVIKAVTDRKMYNGKVDRVKLFQMMNSEWKKSPFLKK
jgi:hypothetical protein